MVDFPRIKPCLGEWYYGAKCYCDELIPIVDDFDEGKGPSVLKGSGQIQCHTQKATAEYIVLKNLSGFVTILPETIIDIAYARAERIKNARGGRWIEAGQGLRLTLGQSQAIALRLLLIGILDPILYPHR